MFYRVRAGVLWGKSSVMLSGARPLRALQAGYPKQMEADENVLLSVRCNFKY